ncbi:MAG: DUF2341 domain-containing protein, partial [Thermodesulfobacteriota bacterium]
MRGKRYELFFYEGGVVSLYKNNFGARTLLDSSVPDTFGTDTPSSFEISTIGSNIVVKINAIELFNVNDASITETGKISLNLYGAGRFGGYPLGFWMMNYLYVDDSYEAVGNPNKAVVLNEKLKGKETYLIERPVFDFSFFKAVSDSLQASDGPEVTKEEAPTKSISLAEACLAKETLDLLKDSGCWYDEDWGFRKKITIDHTKVVTSTQTNFPVLVLLTTDAGLASEAQADGDDILFTDSTGLVKLKHELVLYTTATGYMEAWVKIPSLSSSVDTVIYMYYGNSGASAQQDPTNVWDANYRAVYHLEGAYNATPGEVLDSTGNNFDGEASAGDVPAQVDGKVGKGQDFEESTREEILFDASNTMMGTGGKTIGSAPSFVGKGTASNSAGTSLTPSYPASLAESDFLVLVVGLTDSSDDDTTVNLPAGWTFRYGTLVSGSTYKGEGSNVDGKIFIATRSVPPAGLTGTLSITIATPDAKEICQALIYAYRGVNLLTPIEGGALQSGSGTTVTMPSVTTTDVNRLVVAFSVNGADNAIANPPGETGGDWVESTGGEDRTTTGNDITQDAFQSAMASP